MIQLHSISLNGLLPLKSLYLPNVDDFEYCYKWRKRYVLSVVAFYIKYPFPFFWKSRHFSSPPSQPGHGPLALRTVTGANQGTSPAGLRD